MSGLETRDWLPIGLFLDRHLLRLVFRHLLELDSSPPVNFEDFVYTILNCPAADAQDLLQDYFQSQSETKLDSDGLLASAAISSMLTTADLADLCTHFGEPQRFGSHEFRTMLETSSPSDFVALLTTVSQTYPDFLKPTQWSIIRRSEQILRSRGLSSAGGSVLLRYQLRSSVRGFSRSALAAEPRLGWEKYLQLVYDFASQFLPTDTAIECLEDAADIYASQIAFDAMRRENVELTGKGEQQRWYQRSTERRRRTPSIRKAASLSGYPIVLIERKRGRQMHGEKATGRNTKEKAITKDSRLPLSHPNVVAKRKPTENMQQPSQQSPKPNAEKYPTPATDVNSDNAIDQEKDSLEKPSSKLDAADNQSHSERLDHYEAPNTAAQRRPRQATGITSNYFTTPAAVPKAKASKRQPAGTSCIPVPPLSSAKFGLIQEELANNPFHLLLAVVFLNKTRGAHAVPALRALIHRYPTPSALATATTADIVPLIRHLGLQNQRAAKLIALARAWVAAPPAKDRRHRTPDYPCKGAHRAVGPDEVLADADERAAALEIAHLPGAGAYAWDSWRIFCRDVLRGLARGWNGEGAGPLFEPEWKRVVPADKELRAFLRWLWLREGWEWDPRTGEKGVAGQRLMEAVERGGFAWSDDGGEGLE